MVWAGKGFDQPLNELFFFLIMIVVTASSNTIAGSVTANSTAKIVGPTRVAESLGDESITSNFVSGMTGDLVIRIFGPVALVGDSNKLDRVILVLEAALNNQCASCGLSHPEFDSALKGSAMETGLLNGNPVRNVGVHPVKPGQSGVLGVSVIVDYN